MVRWEPCGLSSYAGFLPSVKDSNQARLKDSNGGQKTGTGNKVGREEGRETSGGGLTDGAGGR